MLLTRFAWACFADENFPFFRGPDIYSVRLFDTATGGMNTEDGLRSQQIRERAKLFDAYLTRSRSVSPKKRALEASDEEGSGEETDGPDSTWAEVADWPPRGRRRNRSWDFDDHPDKPPSLARDSMASSWTSAMSPAKDAADSGRLIRDTSNMGWLNDSAEVTREEPPLKKRNVWKQELRQYLSPSQARHSIED